LKIAFQTLEKGGAGGIFMLRWLPTAGQGFALNCGMEKLKAEDDVIQMVLLWFSNNLSPRAARLTPYADQ
jgi:hypothetical protein